MFHVQGVIPERFSSNHNRLKNTMGVTLNIDIWSFNRKEEWNQRDD
jgi:hypothetical protein